MPYLIMNLTSTSQIKNLLAEHGLRPKKRLGQNFLIDRNVLDRLVISSGTGKNTNVLEIGPGLGVVTRELALSGARVVCIEADKNFESILRDTLTDVPDVEIIIQDFLDVDLPVFFDVHGDGKWIVVGNLPYYITSPILAKLIEAKKYISSVLLMVQREVAARLQADPGSDDYSALTIFVQYHCDIQSVMKVSKNVFYPIPEVDSELIKLVMRDAPKVDVSDERLFFRIVRAAFGKRRKTLMNALSSSDDLLWEKDRTRSILESACIDGGRRGETLSLQEFAVLTDTAVR